MKCEKCKMLSSPDRYNQVIDAAKDNSYEIAASCISNARIEYIFLLGVVAGVILVATGLLLHREENNIVRILVGIPGILIPLLLMLYTNQVESSAKEKAAKEIFKRFLLKMHTEKYLSDQEAQELEELIDHCDNIASVQDLKEKAYEIDYSLRYGCCNHHGAFPTCEELRSKISERTNLKDF